MQVNHFPNAREISRKDHLKRNLYRLRNIPGRAGDAFDMFPATFTLPHECVCCLLLPACCCCCSSGCSGRHWQQRRRQAISAWPCIRLASCEAPDSWFGSCSPAAHPMPFHHGVGPRSAGHCRLMHHTPVTIDVQPAPEKTTLVMHADESFPSNFCGGGERRLASLARGDHLFGHAGTIHWPMLHLLPAAH